MKTYTDEAVAKVREALTYCEALNSSVVCQKLEALALLDNPVEQEHWGIYSGHRLTPTGTTEFYGYANDQIEPGTRLYTAPQEKK